MKRGRLFLDLLFMMPVLLCASCGFLPGQKIQLEEFVHNLSQDLDCLAYCAQKSAREPASVFELREPLEITLSISQEGKITGQASPNLFSVVGLNAAGGAERAGTLHLKLTPMENCRKVQIVRKGKREPLVFENAYLYFGVVEGREHLYLRGLSQAKERGAQCFMRLPLSEVEQVSCTPYPRTNRDMPWCKCPELPETRR